MNYLDIKKELEGFWDELGYEQLIKGLIAFELDEKDENILNQLYEYYYSYSECSLLNDILVDKYNELKGGEENEKVYY